MTEVAIEFTGVKGPENATRSEKEIGSEGGIVTVIVTEVKDPVQAVRVAMVIEIGKETAIVKTGNENEDANARTSTPGRPKTTSAQRGSGRMTRTKSQLQFHL